MANPPVASSWNTARAPSEAESSYIQSSRVRSFAVDLPRQFFHSCIGEEADRGEAFTRQRLQRRFRAPDGDRVGFSARREHCLHYSA